MIEKKAKIVIVVGFVLIVLIIIAGGLLESSSRYCNKDSDCELKMCRGCGGKGSFTFGDVFNSLIGAMCDGQSYGCSCFENTCVDKMSIITNYSQCEILNSQALKDRCYLDFAVKNNDKNMCQYIVSKTFKEPCLGHPIEEP
ncbi:MAG: hypothetical protein AB1467_06240 [Candidatus Diapherotrites archaeon]